MQRLLSLGARGGVGAAAAAAAAAPSSANCHAQTTRLPLFRPKVDADQQGTEDLQGWELPRLKEGQVFFDSEEIEQSVTQIFDRVYRPDRARLEDHSESETDADSVESFGNEANLLIEQADRSAGPYGMQDMLTNMLKQPAVQHACMTALMADKGFRDMVEGQPLLDGPPSASTAANVLIEEIDESHAQDRVHPLSGLVDALGSHFAKLGEGFKAVSGTVGGFLINMGYRLHSILGKPGTSGKPEPDGVPRKLREEWWAKALMTVACSIFLVMVLKRVPAVRL